MSHFRFIHAADFHLGSQLQKLEQYPGAPIEKIRGAPQRSVENIIDLAIERNVAALIIAGDILDGPWNDVRIGLWLVQQFRRLERANIRVFCIRGNHDAISVVRNAIQWPENVYEFSAEASTAPVLDCGLAVHGQSFEKTKVTENLAAGYPSAVNGAFNLGVLHTSLTGSGAHDTYAPTDVATLRERGYQYWALGHIHTRSLNSHAEDFWVGFSGNTQGRNVRESGPKGCYLVDVSDRNIDSVEFIASDVARWSTIELDLTEIDSIGTLQEELRNRIEEAHLQNQGRVLALRVLLKGTTELHSLLGNPGKLSELSVQFRAYAAEMSDVWMEKTIVATLPVASARVIQEANALLTEIQKVSAQLQEELASSNTTIPASIELPRKLLETKLGPYLRELGWMNEADPNWKAILEPWLDQATQYLTQSFTSPNTISQRNTSVKSISEKETALPGG